MDESRWQQLVEVANRALQLQGEARATLLAEHHRNHPELADDLARFMAALTGADAFAAEVAQQMDEPLLDPCLDIGTVLGHWRVERLLGWGGMGVVYLAQRADDLFEQRVAIKVLASTLQTSADRERFHTERQLLARLEHPAIARLIDGGVSEEDHPYYVLEYVDGQPVDTFAARATLDEVLDVFEHICDAVAYAHAHLVVHCDLKPANVLVSASGQAKLLDFGIARSMESASLERDPNAYLNTPVTRNYAAPELLMGADVDTRADVYSLGVLLYRLLAGRQPYALSIDQVLAVQQGESQPRVPELPHATHALPAIRLAELRAIVARATRPVRAARTPSVQHLVEQLRQVRSGSGLEEPPPGIRAYRLRRAARRNLAATALAVSTVVFAALLVVGLSIGLVVTRAESRRANLAQQDHEQVLAFLVRVFAETDPSQQLLDPHLSDSIQPLTAKELVERAAHDLGTADLGSPSATALLRLTVGEIASDVGAHATARGLLQRAVEDTTDAAQRGRALARLGATEAYLSTDHGRSVELLEAAVAACDEAKDVVCSVTALRTAAMAGQDLDQKRDAYQRALKRLRGDREAFDERAWLEAHLTYGLGHVEHLAGNYSESSSLFLRAQGQLDRLEDPPALLVAQTGKQAASILRIRGETDEAVRLLEESREIFVALLGADHPSVADVEEGLALAYAKLDRYDEALPMVRHSYEVQRDRFGDHDQHTITGRTVLAEILREAGLLARARAEIEANIVHAAGQHGLVTATRVAAKTAADQGDQQAALSFARAHLDATIEHHGPDGPMADRAQRLLEAIASETYSRVD
ncbi:MAG: serine/threonine-protein kinase [Myxococcales bacterium]|nr:serine/threonine-protein kinase [Myxococcales bacterium]